MPGSDSHPASAGRRQATAVLAGATAGIAWGTQFPILKDVFKRVDPYLLTSLRYGFTALILVVFLGLREGRVSLRFDGLWRRAWTAGGIGVTGGVMVVFIGVQHCRAQDAALVVATQPLLTALLLRLRGETRLSPLTLVFMVVALAGVMLVITRGHPGTIASGEIGWGLGLVFAGQLAWAHYTIERERFPGWSTLRFSALTAFTGAIVVIVLAAAAEPLGWSRPSASGAWAEHWRLAYFILVPTLIALTTWNASRAVLGAQNSALFLNLVPVTAFVYEMIRGYRPNAAEVIGALVVIGALTANNLLGRPAGVGEALQAPGPAGAIAVSAPGVSDGAGPARGSR